VNTIDKKNIVTFQSQITKLFPKEKPEKIAVLPTTEYEGIFKNGGVGTYYKNLAKKLNSDGWYVILISCDFESNYLGESYLTEIQLILTTNKLKNLLNLSPFHQQILAGVEDKWVDFLGYSCLFYLQGIINYFPDAKIYVEFHEMLGIGYYSLQGKKSNILGANCTIAVTMHSGHEWIYEANEKYNIEFPEWLWEVAHYEQFCCENAPITLFPSYYLNTKVKSYGWDISNGRNMPNYIPLTS
jgi:O-antigen biosynthesis protein